MKKIIYLFLIFIPALVVAQYKTEIITAPNTNVYVYLGTLPVSNANDLHKLKVDIFGGAWESSSIGETSYYIANRNGLVINQTTMGGSNDNRFTLHAYNNLAGGIDFYLLTSNYTAIAVKSYTLGYDATQLITNTTSSSPPQLTEITPLKINPITVTDQSGNVGIGTTSPDAKLTVNGTVHSREVKVDVNIAPDYVFEKDYKLKTLAEVQKYIAENKHLPEIPSAKVMEQNGVDLSNMNMQLLKKVEELTLYLIEKDKSEKKQASRIRALEQQVHTLIKKK